MRIDTNRFNFVPPLSRTCISLTLCITHKVMSVAMGRFQKKDAQNTYNLISIFYQERAFAFRDYRLFENQIMCPCVNAEKVKNLRKPFDQARIAKLIEIINLQKKVSITVTPSNFPKQKSSIGICGSLSLNFISKLLKAGANTPETLDTAICSIGSKFREGASAKTGIIQGIQYTLGYSNEWRKSRNLALDYFQTIASLYKVRLTPVLWKLRFDAWDKAESELTPRLNALENGVYWVYELNAKKKKAHAAAYIKSDGKHYLFDPNFGTIRIPANKDANYLIRSMRSVSCNQLGLFKCELLP